MEILISDDDFDDFGGPNGDFDGVFKSPEDMRDFAANFFESFFFGGGFAQGSNGPSSRRHSEATIYQRFRRTNY